MTVPGPRSDPRVFDVGTVETPSPALTFDIIHVNPADHRRAAFLGAMIGGMMRSLEVSGTVKVIKCRCPDQHRGYCECEPIGE